MAMTIAHWDDIAGERAEAGQSRVAPGKLGNSLCWEALGLRSLHWEAFGLRSLRGEPAGSPC